MKKLHRRFDIRREGHPLSGGAETLMRMPRVEMTDGKLFSREEDRLFVLGLLLESVGVDAALRLVPPEIWRQAIEALPADPDTKPAAH